MDWTDFREGLLPIVAIFGLGVAWAGLLTWRKQLKGKTEYELARRLLKAVFDVRNALRWVRDPLLVGDQTEVYEARLQEVDRALPGLRVEVLEAEVLFGTEAVKSRVPALHQCVIELRIALRGFLRHQAGALQLPDGKVAEYEQTLFDTGTDEEPDEYGATLNEAVEAFEAWLRPYLRL